MDDGGRDADLDLADGRQLRNGVAQAKGDGSGTAIFDTHPAAGERISELEKFMPALERYASNPQNEPRFRSVVKK